MKPSDRYDALTIIHQRQAGESGMGTAPVTVKIGTTWSNNQVDHEALILIDAPAAILNELKDKGFSLSVNKSAGGV